MRSCSRSRALQQDQEPEPPSLSVLRPQKIQRIFLGTPDQDTRDVLPKLASDLLFSP